MSDRPILFSAPMVRAILEGRKTQTRRIVKPQPTVDENGMHFTTKHGKFAGFIGHAVEDKSHWLCPYGVEGDRLWVRETWAHVPITAYRCSEGVQQTANPTDPDMAAVYAAGWDRSRPGRWRPSIHMPRWASRITLEITGVRVERLQEISEADAKAEGIDTVPIEGWRNYLWHGDPDARDRSVNAWPHQFSNYLEAKGSYSSLWEQINGPGSWDANPWVWVVEFKRGTP